MKTATPLPARLTPSDRKLLRALSVIVPVDERAEWLRTWQAELWHNHHRGQIAAVRTSANLTVGLALDAVWLRTDRWRQKWSGTAGLCLASLTMLLMLTIVISLVMTGEWPALRHYLLAQSGRFLLLAPSILFVASTTSSRRPMLQKAESHAVDAIRRNLFFVMKTCLVLMVTFLLSAGLCQPMQAQHFRNTADVLQVLSFAFFALVGLRWSFADQEQRCKRCLRLLALPARVGRPSHNLLEWNGTELICKDGHGRLSVPEIETSWRESSEWVSV
jgi:hypothetical protein